MIDVGAEGVRRLAAPLIKIAAAQHVVYRQADARIELTAQPGNVQLGVDAVELCVVPSRAAPGRTGLDSARVAARRRLCRSFAPMRRPAGLGRVERLPHQGVQLVKHSQHFLRALFGQGKLHYVVVAKAQFWAAWLQLHQALQA